MGGTRKDRIFLPDRPFELNFVMRPAAGVAGKLIDEQGRPLAGYSVALTGVDPSAVLERDVFGSSRSAGAILPGRHPDDLPISIRGSQGGSPSLPGMIPGPAPCLRFEQPDKGDVRAWFGNREIRLREFVLRVAGPGVHGRNCDADRRKRGRAQPHRREPLGCPGAERYAAGREVRRADTCGTQLSHA